MGLPHLCASSLAAPVLLQARPACEPFPQAACKICRALPLTKASSMPGSMVSGLTSFTATGRWPYSSAWYTCSLAAVSAGVDSSCSEVR